MEYCGHLYTYVELDRAFESSIANLRFLGNGESQLDSLGAQLILA